MRPTRVALTAAQVAVLLALGACGSPPDADDLDEAMRLACGDAEVVTGDGGDSAECDADGRAIRGELFEDDPGEDYADTNGEIGDSGDGLAAWWTVREGGGTWLVVDTLGYPYPENELPEELERLDDLGFDAGPEWPS